MNFSDEFCETYSEKQNINLTQTLPRSGKEILAKVRSISHLNEYA